MSWLHLESAEYKRLTNMIADLELRAIKLEAKQLAVEDRVKKLQGKLDQHLYQESDDTEEEPKRRQSLNNPMFSI